VVELIQSFVRSSEAVYSTARSVFCVFLSYIKVHFLSGFCAYASAFLISKLSHIKDRDLPTYTYMLFMCIYMKKIVFI